MKKIIGILLVVLALFLGYTGMDKLSNSGESVEILGVELSAQDNKARTTAFVYFGLAVVSLLGGVVLVKN